MGTRLFVGNLSYAVSEQELRDTFTAEGIDIRSVRVALDRETGRPRGFAFVETGSDDDAKKSIATLSGRMLQGRTIVIEEAQARPQGGGPGAGPRRGPPPPREGGGPGRGFGGGNGRPEGGDGGGFNRGGGYGNRPPPAPGGGFGGGGGFNRGPARFNSGYGTGPAPGPMDARPEDGTRHARKFEKFEKKERRDRKRSSRPRPEDNERGNWRWRGDDDE